MIFDEKPGNLFPIEAVSLLCDHYKAKFDTQVMGQTTSLKGSIQEVNDWQTRNLNHISNFLKSDHQSHDTTETIVPTPCFQLIHIC
jgi:hypothetical protein